MRNPQHKKRGYTLIEILVTTAIMGLASAIVVPSLLAGGTMGVQAAARMIVADALYAQNDAIAQQRNRKVIFDVTNNRYRLTDESDQTLNVAWKGQGSSAENYVVDFEQDSRFAGVELVRAEFGSTSELEFDDLGAPLQGGEIEITFNGQSYLITVASFTGRVTVSKL